MQDPTAPSPPPATPVSETPVSPAPGGLAYEETPVIETPPVQEAVPPFPQAPPPPSPEQPVPPVKKGGGIFSLLGNLILFAVLFVLGIWLSTIGKQYLSTGEGIPLSAPAPTPTPTAVISTPAPRVKAATPTGVVQVADQYADWKTYPVTNGRTRLAIVGISFRLPPTQLAPICDGTSCGSQGTFLPGKTRFTVAPRGKDQVLADFRGSIVSDLRGQAFTAKETTIAGKKAVEFSGTFTGSTVEGYGFSQMRGIMIEANADLSLELNHFSPNGVTTDFAADDLLFDQILKTLTFSSLTPLGVGGTPANVPTVTSSRL